MDEGIEVRRVGWEKVAGLVLWLAAVASATTYYVDPSGSNANTGLSPATAWRTLLKVSITTLSAGDVVLFKRDAVWNETLVPLGSGAAGNLIKFDAYGNGRAPRFTGLYATKTSDWTNTSGSVWQVTLTATQAIALLKFVQFGRIWGNLQASQGALAHDRDWFYDGTGQILYVYSSTGNPVTRFGSVSPIILSGQALIKLNGVHYVEVQHIQMDWYDSYGMEVLGDSDNLWLANLLADSQVPNAATTIGFFVHPSVTVGDIHLFNTDSHRNYKGYQFTGTATGIELKNCRGYANRAIGLQADSSGVTYSYCHFYANNIATGISVDFGGTPGPVDGGHNLAADIPPQVRGFKQYPARVTVTYDDPGLVEGSDTFIAGLLPAIHAEGVPLSIAVVTGYDLSQTLAPTFQSWIDAGWDVVSHSVSHQYFQFPNAFTLQYTGTAASSVTLTVSGGALVITAPGDTSAQVNFDLSHSGTDLVAGGLDTLGGIVATLNQRGVFAITADPNMKTAVKSEDLADVTAHDIKSSAYTLLMDKTRLMTDELGWSKAWMDANLTGLPTNRVYVYPGTFEDSSTEAIAVAAGYAGARGSGSMKPAPNAATVLGTGVNVQNILSEGMVPNFQGLSDAQLTNKVKALVFKSAVWGVPIGLFVHVGDLSAHQVMVLIEALKVSGATLMTDTALVNYLLGTQNISGTTFYADSASGMVDVRPLPESPVVNAGTSVADEYKFDLLGIDQTRFGSGWEMGAFAAVPEFVGRVK